MNWLDLGFAGALGIIAVGISLHERARREAGFIEAVVISTLVLALVVSFRLGMRAWQSM